MVATVYFRLCRQSSYESEWCILDYENGVIRPADQLMGPTTPPFRRGSKVLAAGSEIYLFTSSDIKNGGCDSYTSIDTSHPEPKWTEPSLIELPNLPHLHPICEYLDGKIFLFSKSYTRMDSDIWADVLDTSEKTWSIAKVPKPLPPDLASEMRRKRNEKKKKKNSKDFYILCGPALADPLNHRILMCYGRAQLSAYYPATNIVKDFSDPKYEVRGWYESHVIVDRILLSSTGEVHCFQNSLFAHDLADGCRPMSISWYFSPDCKEQLFRYPQDSQWDAVLDLGEGRLCLSMNFGMYSRAEGFKKYIGGVIVDVERCKVHDDHPNCDSELVVWIRSMFLIPTEKPGGYCCRDFLSIITPV